MDKNDQQAKPAFELVEQATTTPAHAANKGDEIRAALPRAHDHHSHRLDAAADLLRKAVDEDGGRIVVTAADNKRVLRRIDTVILPIILFVYFLQFIDKTTISYASVFGLIEDTNLHGAQYSWLGSIVYLAQLIGQPLVAFLLVKLPIGKVISAAVFFWGATLACMAAARNFRGLMASRFFLGLFEASVVPCFIAITQMWWRRREQTTRVGFWFAMNGIANMFGSLITYGITHIRSPHLKEYQLIFMIFGIITVAFSFVILTFMPDSPLEARFLNDHDRVIAVERLRINQMGIMSREWRWDHAREAFLDIKTWCWFSLIVAISIPSGGITAFGPLIVKSFGFNSFHAILFNMPFGFVQLISIVGGAYLATYIRKKGPVIMGLCLPPIAGCVVLMVLPHTTGNRGAFLVGYYITSFYTGITPLIYSWSSQNTAGDTKRKCVNAVLTAGQCVGNIVGPQLYTTAEAPRYARGLRSNLALFAVLVVLAAVTTLYLVFLNKSHSKRRVAAGKSAVIVDMSLLSAKEAERILHEAGDENQATGDQAFENLTDLENDEFVFVY